MASYINLIFAPRGLAAVLAHVGSYCVTGIALPPVDAISFIVALAFEREDEEGSRGFLRNVSVFQFSF